MLNGQIGLVLGIANNRSIAYGIAKEAYKNSAKLIVTYPNDKIVKRLEPIAEELNSEDVIMCDVSSEESIANLFNQIGKKYGRLDFIVHSVAYSDKDELKGEYINTTLENFLNAMHISCYSFTSIARNALPLMKEKGGSMLTVTYYGAIKVVPFYNVMGPCKAALEASVKYIAADLGKYAIKVNGISAGPIKTLAASGINNFSHILRWNRLHSPLKRNTTIEDVAGGALYLISPLNRGTTGTILYVDSGYHVIGVPAVAEETSD